jgi:hypothetical protein
MLLEEPAMLLHEDAIAVVQFASGDSQRHGHGVRGRGIGAAPVGALAEPDGGGYRIGLHSDPPDPATGVAPQGTLSREPPPGVKAPEVRAR